MTSAEPVPDADPMPDDTCGPDAEQMPPLVVATDLDGTLLRPDGTVGTTGVRVLQRLSRQGVHLVFVTGRPPATVTPIADEVDHTGLAVCSNGAAVIDLSGPRPHPVRVYELEPATIRGLIAAIGVDVPGTSFGVQHTDRFVCEPAYPYDPGFPPPEVAGSVDEIADIPAIKLVVRHQGLDGDTLLHACRQAAAGAGLAERAELTISGPAGFVEIAPSGVSKASTLSVLCQDWGVPASRVVAFGDMPNDVEMLAWAGRSFAMPHAHPTTLAAADDVTAYGNAEDGVARTLARIFGLDA